MNDQQAVFLVDDDESVRDALGLYLEIIGYKTKAYDCATAFLDAYAGEPGCLILDINMPGIDGLELQDTLTSRGVDIPIIFLTGTGDIPMSVKAIKSGAVDFLEKPAPYDLLKQRVEQALIEDAKRREHASKIDTLRERFARLTPREREILDLIVSGKANKQIARELDISHRTVEVHRSRLMEKLQADSLPELVIMAKEAGVIGPPTANTS